MRRKASIVPLDELLSKIEHNSFRTAIQYAYEEYDYLEEPSDAIANAILDLDDALMYGAMNGAATVETDPGGDSYIVFPFASRKMFSDAVSRSNYEILMEEFPFADDLNGEVAIPIHKILDNPKEIEEIARVIKSFLDSVALDPEDVSKLEFEEAEEAWQNFGFNDIFEDVLTEIEEAPQIAYEDPHYDKIFETPFGTLKMDIGNPKVYEKVYQFVDQWIDNFTETYMDFGKAMNDFDVDYFIESTDSVSFTAPNDLKTRVYQVFEKDFNRFYRSNL